VVRTTGASLSGSVGIKLLHGNPVNQEFMGVKEHVDESKKWELI